MASDFVKYINFKKSPVFVLKGKIPPKYIPEAWIAQELEEDPPELEANLKGLIFPGNFRPMVGSPFELGEADMGEIKCTMQGMVFIAVNQAWIMIGSAIAKYK